MKKHITLFGVFAVLLSVVAFVSPAYALVSEVSATPRNWETDSYLLSVSTNAAQGGIAFHVTVTAKRFDIEANSWAGLEIMTPKLFSVTYSKPAIQVALEKGERVWKADFTVSRESLNNPDLYFAFRVPYDPKKISMPDSYVFQIRLQDFAKP